ncbi:leucine-rich repeat domain-containing protein [Streptacidiphilus jeojiense]|nr:leucine-rich repeat domain-containing protein [Streptacidiphilus jeojiense]
MSTDAQGVAEERIEATRRSKAHRLDLSDLGLSVLPESLCNLTAITTLDLSGNTFSALPEWLGDLTALATLSLSKNQISALPEWLGDLTSLTELHLDGNELSVLSEWLGNLTNLTDLDLSKNKLSALPECLASLTALTSLDLAGNELPELPEWLGNLTALTDLDLSDNGLSALPEFLAGLTALTSLDLGGNKLPELPEWLGNLTALTDLDLSKNKLSALPECLADLTALTSLDLAGNELPELPEWLGNLTNLTDLDLSGNNLSALPECLTCLAALTSLDLARNEFLELPEWLGNLTNLTDLDLSGNNLSALPECLASLTALTSLDLGGNKLSVLLEWLGNLTGLTDLDLSDNGLSALPEFLAGLTALTSLDLGGNKLSVLPEWLGNLTALTDLDLSDNKLSALPESIENLTKLLSMDISKNDLSALPESLGNLARLTSLSLADNRISVLPNSIGKLTDLTYLYLYNAGLSALPESIGDLASLTDLILSENELSVLPDSIGKLTRLTSLYLYMNKISVLPSSIGDLVRLELLNLTGNDLLELPESLGNLTLLNHLYLSNSNLSMLPDSIGKLTKLQVLEVDGNSLTSPPPEVIAAGAGAVVAFLSGLAANPVRQWVSKVLVVGQGRAGKTSLLKALRGEAFDLGEDSTHGLTIGSLRMAHPDPACADVMMELATWDFGGQEIYHATHQFFLTERSLFVLVWDAQVGWEASLLYYWLDMIKARAPYAPVVLVATHLGPRPPDFPLNNLRQAYPGLIVESMAVDSETGHGLEELRAVIRRVAADLPLMGTRWPRPWLEAADTIRAHPENHVPAEELYAIMARCGVEDLVHQRALAAALHSLGDILFYPQDDELQDLVVLHPQWVTSYVSKVLDDETKELQANGALFTKAHQRRLWHDLSSGMRQHFVSMMERFDLSYRTSDRASSLVVELLPWDPPDFQNLWEGAFTSAHRELRLRYRLHTVPPGIPTWFIAREHRFTTGFHWRTGVLLRHSDGAHFGLLTMDKHAKTAELRVRGPYPQDFFAVLKDGLEETLDRYPGLGIERLVPCPVIGDDGEACPHEFRHEQLVARLSLEPPRETIECPVDFAELNVRQLLQGIEPPARSRSEELAEAVTGVVVGLRQQVEHHNEDVLDELRAMRIKQDAIAAEQQRTFLAAQRLNQSLNQVLCPSVMAVEHVRKRAGGLMGSVVRVHLYCEAPGAWHRAPGAEPYELKLTSGAIATVLPYVQTMLSLLKYVVPVAGASIGIASEDLAKHLKGDIETMEALVAGLPDELHTHDLSGVQTMVRATEDPQFRAMQGLLLALDPKQAWSGLSKVATPEGHIYWLCAAHTRQYRGLPGESAINP